MGTHPMIPKITKAVAESRGADPVELEYTLQDFVETDAIRSLARHNASTWTLTFQLPDRTVTVTSEKEVLVDGNREEVWV